MNADYKSAVSASRKLRGLCFRCGENPPTAGYVSCAGCRAYHAEAAAKSRAKNATNWSDLKAYADQHGLCRLCREEPRAPGLYRCEPCAEMFRVKSKVRRDSRVERGLCAYCDTPSAQYRCERHQASHLRKQAIRRAARARVAA